MLTPELEALSEGWVLQWTDDKSPTLSLGKAGEWMHHRAGALGETLYVYGHASEIALEGGARRFVSVGLGVGYVEWVLFGLALKSACPRDGLRIQSFEGNPGLRAGFERWLTTRETGELGNVFGGVVQAVAEHFGLSAETLQAFAREHFTRGWWTLEPALTVETMWPHRADCIFFDAFSQKTSPQLWDAAFLQQWLTQCANVPCTFASYASNRSLRSALHKAGFTLIGRQGFGGKRECTLAHRPSL